MNSKSIFCDFNNLSNFSNYSKYSKISNFLRGHSLKRIFRLVCIFLNSKKLSDSVNFRNHLSRFLWILLKKTFRKIKFQLNGTIFYYFQKSSHLSLSTTHFTGYFFTLVKIVFENEFPSKTFIFSRFILNRNLEIIHMSF